MCGSCNLALHKLGDVGGGMKLWLLTGASFCFQPVTNVEVEFRSLVQACHLYNYVAIKKWVEVECSKIIDCNDKTWLVVILMQFSFLPTEFQQQEGMKTHQKNMQLYDTPYEPEGSGVESDSESVVSHRLRESKLPQDDDRPADEYDQPWEWNKVTIPALAGRIPRSQPQNFFSQL